MLERALKDAIESGLSFDHTLPFITASGARRWVRAIGLPERSDGVTTRLAGALQDLLLFWVQSLPMAPDLVPDQMMAAATYPLAAAQATCRALWAGYRATAGLAG